MIARAKRQRRTDAALPPTIRVAVYTRQSVADDKEFGSIEAQREAVEAFVKSQRSEGWVALETHYDDHGFSGSTLQRPAFQRLLADVEQGRVDVVATYRIDRLSRSLLDFAKIMDLLERCGVAFVSVTQQFSTANSMGKLTLNILMSFAEFERASIAERTRDKMRATRRKGMWTGGRPVLGYDVSSKKLVVNRKEAEHVRAIFEAYLEHGTLLATLRELERRGIRNKTLRTQAGRTVAGKRFNKNTLSRLLTNPLYAGRMRCADEIVDGVHESIVDQATWDSVQAQLRDHRRSGGSEVRNKWGALLRGIARCGRCGAPMVHHFTQKRDRVYRYYICQRAQQEGADRCPGSRAPAGELEEHVVSKVRAIGRDPKLLAAVLAAAQQDAEARKPERIAESRRLGHEKARLSGERANLVDAVAQGGSAAPTLLARVTELDQELTRIAERQHEVAAELAAIETAGVDEADLAAALAAFDPVWDALLPRERARVLRLLLEEVSFDGQAGEVAIKLRPAGIRSFGSMNTRETR